MWTKWGARVACTESKAQNSSDSDEIDSNSGEEVEEKVEAEKENKHAEQHVGPLGTQENWSRTSGYLYS